MLEVGRYYRFASLFTGAGVIKRHTKEQPDRVLRGMEFSGGHLTFIDDSSYNFVATIGRTRYHFTISKSTFKRKEFIESEPPSQN
jgi:predicted RNA-binding protein (virulence factor B family)